MTSPEKGPGTQTQNKQVEETTTAEEISTTNSHNSEDSNLKPEDNLISDDPNHHHPSNNSNNNNRNMCRPTTQQPAEDDPHDIGERFLEHHNYYFRDALMEIQNGCKESCWSWFILPTPPYIVGGVERGSHMNRKYALRGDDAVKAFLTFSGGRLRANYLLIVRAIQSQLRRGNTMNYLLGPLDDKKAVSSFQLFERIGKQMDDDELVTACSEVLSLAGVKPQKKRRTGKGFKGWIVKKKSHSM